MCQNMSGDAEKCQKVPESAEKYQMVLRDISNQILLVS